MHLSFGENTDKILYYLSLVNNLHFVWIKFYFVPMNLIQTNYQQKQQQQKTTHTHTNNEVPVKYFEILKVWLPLAWIFYSLINMNPLVPDLPMYPMYLHSIYIYVFRFPVLFAWNFAIDCVSM